MFLTRRLHCVLIFDLVVDEQEDGHVEHRDELQGDAGVERALAADVVNEEQGAQDGGEKLYNAWRGMGSVGVQLVV